MTLSEIVWKERRGRISIDNVNNLATLQTHSTVSFMRCSGKFFSGDVFFCFTITYRRPIFTVPQYSQYQFFLYETITEQREKGKTFDQIADLLNKKDYLSVRGKKFKGNHVHSIVKKKRLKDEKLEKSIQRCGLIFV